MIFLNWSEEDMLTLEAPFQIFFSRIYVGFDFIVSCMVFLAFFLSRLESRPTFLFENLDKLIHLLFGVVKMWCDSDGSFTKGNHDFVSDQFLI